MRTQTASPSTRARTTRSFVVRPLASVLLAMGAVSLAVPPGSAMASSTAADVTAATVAASSPGTPTVTATRHTATGDGTLATGDRRTRLSE
jgi:hypothetical protein